MSSNTQVQTDAPGVAEARLGPDLTGEVLLGRYRVLRQLGHGGMGTVYVGEHTAIGKKFAIKVLGTEFAKRSDLVERFLREARAASMIPQQNVVEITDFGETPEGSVFFVMEYLEGEDLRQMLEREGRQPWSRVKHLMVQMCKALQAAHDKGIVHRDMKPDNCFRITREADEDFIKVLDFGIAKVQTSEGEGGKGLTQTGMLFGTPEYMSPEQAQGAQVDHRVDIYALGVIMYQLLSGVQPFRGDTFMAVLTKHMFETPVAPSELVPDANIPPEVEAIVLKAMQKDAGYRFQSMSEMLEAIDGVDAGEIVEVVAEQIERPKGGPTNFATVDGGVHPVRATPVPGQAASSDALGSEETLPQTLPGIADASIEEERRRGRMGLWIGLAGFSAALALGAYIVFGGTEEPVAPKPKVVEVAPAQAPAPIAEPAPAPAPAPEPAAEPAKLSFTTNVPARILDARDRAIYGSTQDESLELPMSSEPMRLILQAEGYAELEIEVVPDRESKIYDFQLEALAAPEPEPTRKGKGKGNKTKGKTLAESPEPDAEPEAKGPPLPSKGSSDGEVKNPFGN